MNTVAGNDGIITVRIEVQAKGFARLFMRKRKQKITFNFCMLTWLEVWQHTDEINTLKEGETMEDKAFRYGLWAAVKSARTYAGKKSMPWTPDEVAEWLLDMKPRVLNEISHTLTESRIGGKRITEIGEEAQEAQEKASEVVKEVADKKKVK